MAQTTTSTLIQIYRELIAELELELQKELERLEGNGVTGESQSLGLEPQVLKEYSLN